MSNLPPQTTPVYATDEDIAVRAGGDFVTLCPLWQQMATGADGVLSVGPPWSLSSVSVNFGSNGVTPNQVIQLTAPKANFPGGGTLLAIDTVVGNVVTLRRLHKDIGVGQPPCPAAGLSGVSFVVSTLDPQIEECSFDIKRRFGIDENITFRTSSWMYDERDLRIATVLMVLQQRYIAECRGDRGDFARKIDLIKSQLADVLDRVQVRWGPFGNSAEPSTLFSCKLSR
jgi:hypothetical protein